MPLDQPAHHCQWREFGTFCFHLNILNFQLGNVSENKLGKSLVSCQTPSAPPPLFGKSPYFFPNFFRRPSLRCRTSTELMYQLWRSTSVCPDLYFSQGKLCCNQIEYMCFSGQDIVVIILNFVENWQSQFCKCIPTGQSVCLFK